MSKERVHTVAFSSNEVYELLMSVCKTPRPGKLKAKGSAPLVTRVIKDGCRSSRDGLVDSHRGATRAELDASERAARRLA